MKIELVRRVSSSQVEPRFRKVVYPGGWDRDVTLPSEPPPSPSAQKHRDFYQPLIEKLLQARFADSAIQYYGHTGRFFRSGFHTDMGYSVSFDYRESAWVTLHIQTGDDELTGRIFDELYAQRNEFESKIDAGSSAEWHWLRHDAYLFSTINIRTDGAIDDPPKELERIRAWMFDLLPKFKEIFDPPIADILKVIDPDS